MVVGWLIPIDIGFFIDIFSVICKDLICLLDLEILTQMINN